jgi:hypothetical protein
MAQNKYQEKYGHFHTHEYNIDHLYCESLNEETILALETICQRLIRNGDHALTLFLGACWNYASHQWDDKAEVENYHKALRWYTQAMNYESTREKANEEAKRIKIILQGFTSSGPFG